MNTHIEYVRPDEIEKRSFEIIGRELEQRGIVLDAVQEPVTKRVIHTTADFDYADTLVYSENAVEKARNLIKNGAHIVTDTNMAKAGINKKRLAGYGGEVHCFMADEDVAAEAKSRGVTRATVSMERAAALHRPVIFAIGNAPTALISLHEMMQEGVFMPAFIIGVPVGFVNVEAAKELIIQSDVPHIVNRGRKGGSNVAAAICNALVYGIHY
ncbi:MAG: precorrin-8X methylmutase [[Bacteroides] pectinophilus]|nr:precorrin-8X methylmutase [[Bacteroides] pectinophilus]